MLQPIHGWWDHLPNNYECGRESTVKSLTSCNALQIDVKSYFNNNAIISLHTPHYQEKNANFDLIFSLLLIVGKECMCNCNTFLKRVEDVEAHYGNQYCME